MEYRIAESGSNGIVFKQGKFSFVLYWLVFAIGLITLPLGLLLVVSGDLSDTTFTITGFGLVFCFGAFTFKQARLTFPTALEFNNHKAHLLITSRRGEEAALPYTAMQDFRIYKAPRAGHTVYLQMKDGSVWDLFRTGTRSAIKAEGVLADLEKNVRLSRSYQSELLVTPQWFRKYEKANTPLYLWRGSSAARNLWYFMGLLYGMALAFYPFVPYARFVFPVVMGAATGFLLYKIWQYSRHWQVLEVGSDEITIGFARGVDELENDSWQREKSKPRSDIAAIHHSADLVSATYNSVLLPSADDLEYIAKIRSGNFELSELGQMLKQHRQLFRIDFTGRDLVDVTRVAQVIREELGDEA